MDTILPRLKAISDKNRLRILSALLQHEELCACQITELLQVAGATASRHLSLMVNAKILKSRKNGRWIYFQINTQDFSLDPILKWIQLNLEKSPQAIQDKKALNNILGVSCEDLCRKQREKTMGSNRQTGATK
jgi:DNA-binding transcriptional ArsR family regulator